jgi:hypothetical protein
MSLRGLTMDAERTPEQLRLVKLRRYIARVSVALLCLFVLFALWRFATEADRQRARDRVQDQRIEKIVARLQLEITADCPFKLTVAELPSEARRAGQPITPTLLRLAAGARKAYIEKGCKAAGYGAPPAVARP